MPSASTSPSSNTLNRNSFSADKSKGGSTAPNSAHSSSNNPFRDSAHSKQQDSLASDKINQFSTMPSYTPPNQDHSSKSSFPVLLAIVPPLVSTVFGSRLGLDIGLFIVTMVWLYLVIKKPEELYDQAKENRLRRIHFRDMYGSTPLNEENMSAGTSGSPVKRSDSKINSASSRFQEEIRKLENLEFKFLLLTFASPVIGGVGLYFLSYLSQSLDPTSASATAVPPSAASLSSVMSNSAARSIAGSSAAHLTAAATAAGLTGVDFGGVSTSASHSCNHHVMRTREGVDKSAGDTAEGNGVGTKNVQHINTKKNERENEDMLKNSSPPTPLNRHEDQSDIPHARVHSQHSLYGASSNNGFHSGFGSGNEQQRESSSSYRLFVISHYNVVLFIMTASIRPFLRLCSRWKEEAEYLQNMIEYPISELDMLKQHSAKLREELTAARSVRKSAAQ